MKNICTAVSFKVVDYFWLKLESQNKWITIQLRWIRIQIHRSEPKRIASRMSCRRTRMWKSCCCSIDKCLLKYILLLNNLDFKVQISCNIKWNWAIFELCLNRFWIIGLNRGSFGSIILFYIFCWCFFKKKQYLMHQVCKGRQFHRSSIFGNQ